MREMGRDVLGSNFFYSGKSVLVGARWISKEEVCRLTQRDKSLSFCRFWWFATGHHMENTPENSSDLQHTQI